MEEKKLYTWCVWWNVGDGLSHNNIIAMDTSHDDIAYEIGQAWLNEYHKGAELDAVEFEGWYYYYTKE